MIDQITIARQNQKFYLLHNRKEKKHQLRSMRRQIDWVATQAQSEMLFN